MSFNKIKTKIEKRKRNKSPCESEVIKSHISSDEINSNPLIKDLTKKITKIKLDSLTKVKPHLTPIKNIKDEKENKLIDNINSFRQIYYEYNQNQKYPKKSELKAYKGEINYINILKRKII